MCVWANFVKNPIGHDGIICGYFDRVVKYLEHLTAVISERMSWNMWQCMELAEFTLIYIGEYLSDLTPYRCLSCCCCCCCFPSLTLRVHLYIFLHMPVNSLPNNNFLDWSKFKAHAEDKINVTEILKFVFGRVENIVGKGENAGYQHFLLDLQCFQKAFFSRLLTLSQTSPGFYLFAVQAFWKHCRKRRNCSFRAISIFPTVFSTIFKELSAIFIQFNLKLSFVNSFSLEESKICRLGKGLKAVLCGKN